nr:DNA polymerase ligase N-terminal domain-containing protein [Mesotoga sp. UBA5825]
MDEGDRKLNKYEMKRDFNKTPEPDGKEASLEWARDRPVFVVQKHAASTLHYDFRIEVDGVLKSWAVPTEDHPLEYGDFEGNIPEGEYGGGTVLLWDRGSYRNLKEDPESNPLTKQIEDGHITIWLEGEKLKGGYALVRTGKAENARWLLVKMNDREADARRNPTSTEPNSVKTGRSLEEIRDSKD